MTCCPPLIGVGATPYMTPPPPVSPPYTPVKTSVYPYNTEKVVELLFDGPVQQLVIQASGLQFVDYLLKYGYDENTVVRFVDYNLLALECMHAIVTEWDGNNYLPFVETYMAKRASFVNKTGRDWITRTGQFQPIMPAQWQHILKTVKFEFRHEDLVLNKGLDVSTWVDNTDKTIIHLSHIFCYDPVAAFVPLKDRVFNENLLLAKLKKHVPSATIVMVERSCSGFTNKKEGIIDMSDLQCPTWHLGGDWNGV